MDVMDPSVAPPHVGTASSSPIGVPSRSLVATRLIADALAILLALAAAAFIRFTLEWFEVTEAVPPTVRAHAAASGLWLGSYVAALAFNRLYDEDTLFPGGGEIARTLRAAVEASAILSIFVFLTQSFYVSRSWFALSVLLSLVFVAAERLGLRTLLRARREAGKNRRAAILVSRSDAWDEWPFEDEHEFDVAARVDPEGFERFVRGLDADEAMSRRLMGAAVVLRARDFSHDEFWQILLWAGQRGWAVFVHSPVRSVGRDRLTVREVAGQTIVKVAPPVLTGPRAMQKRVLDLVVSGALLVLLSPLLVLIAFLIVVTSGRPVLYRQERVGRGGEAFTMIKFRSMSTDAETDTGPVWASEQDERRTRLGSFLRRSGLDELPQLWNVFKGDMSLVGPRPERPAFVEDFEKEMTWYRFRHRMRPGITGWAQSHGLRGNSSLDSRVQFDNWYIEHWSIWLDIKIIAMTARELISGRNAY